MTLPPYVSMAHPDHWVVERCVGLWIPLTRLGFRGLPFLPMSLRRRGGMSFVEMAWLATALRDLGVAFSAGRDWSPSEVVQKLRDDGLFTGSFTEIGWTADGWRLREV